MSRAGMSRRIKLGILANELFAPEIGRMGGFGWAVRQVSECFSQDLSLGIEPYLIMGEWLKEDRGVPVIHGSPVVWRDRRILRYLAKLRRERFDALLAIDYRPNYRLILYALPRTPILVWVRDPWDKEDLDCVRKLKIPGAESQIPQGTIPPRTASLSRVVCLSRFTRRPIRLAVTSPHLVKKIPACYAVDAKSVEVLPNIVSMQPLSSGKSKDPLVVFLARLDPTKRPWIFAELGKRFPDVPFLFMGQRHFHGPGAWEGGTLPPNVRTMGHVDEGEKNRILSSAWVLVNTSIHEGLSVSFLEALACETPVVSSVNPDGLVSRFGIHVGDWPGTGMEGLPAFESALRRLLQDKELRQRLGSEGRAWVNRFHNRGEFLSSLRFILGGMSKTLCAWAGQRTGRVPEALEGTRYK